MEPLRCVTFTSAVAEEARAAAAAKARAAALAARAQELCGGGAAAADPLVVAVLSNDLAQVDAAIRAMKDWPVEVNRRMLNGENALQLALRKQFTALVAPLLLAGASVENRDDSGATALLTQARANGAVSMLVGPFRACVNAMALDGWTALHHAVHFDNRENAMDLLAQGADPSLCGRAPGNVSAYALAAAEAHADTECGRVVAFFVEADLLTYSERNQSHPAFA